MRVFTVAILAQDLKFFFLSANHTNSIMNKLYKLNHPMYIENNLNLIQTDVSSITPAYVISSILPSTILNTNPYIISSICARTITNSPAYVIRSDCDTCSYSTSIVSSTKCIDKTVHAISVITSENSSKLIEMPNITEEIKTLNLCYYSGNNNNPTCEQEANSTIYMTTGARHKERHVCKKCKIWLVENNLAKECNNTNTTGEIKNPESSIGKCYYSGNNNILTCEQEADSTIYMTTGARHKERHVCKKCKIWLIENNLAK